MSCGVRGGPLGRNSKQYKYPPRYQSFTSIVAGAAGLATNVLIETLFLQRGSAPLRDPWHRDEGAVSSRNSWPELLGMIGDLVTTVGNR